MKYLAVALSLYLPAAAAAQQPAFEVASIKPSNYQGGPLRVTARVGADGIDFSNVTPRLCIQRAYGIRPYQLIGPDWIDTERYMIVAKAAGAVPQDQILRMLQTLLTERFQLSFHREAKEMPIYALVVAKGGSKLKEATDEGASQIGPDGREMLFQRVSMGTLVGAIARSIDRPLIDETGLKGLYTFRLSWANETAGPREASEPDDAPSIFTALQERLGLKLESKKAPVDLLVVDRINQPTAN